ncbi:MAG TPA: Fe(2+)-trafficking protein [Tepidisphaeraceae bacterium]|jgi:tetratricopeptide (TPR) repeat protein|nr:Fe(2+)-trafficking protein [Tepidisphaeraceae bacterium]
MADSTARIEQFKKMAEADPGNELGHFSLGRAYADAGQHKDAVMSLERAIEINPNIAKAYQLMGTSLLAEGLRDPAIARLTQGIKIADARGEMLPRNEMIQMLKDLGAAVPEIKQAAEVNQPVGTGEVLCKRCGQVNPKLSEPPFNSDFGRAIFASTCTKCWREAIGMGTKVINELRLPLSDPQAQKVWDQHIREFLNL